MGGKAGSGETVAGGAPFSVEIDEKAPVAIGSILTDFLFDPSVVQLQEIKPGSAWASASFGYGDASSAANAVAGANQSGTLSLQALTTGKPVAAGSGTFVTLSFQSLTGPGGVSKLRLKNAVMSDAASQASLPVILTSGSVTVQPAPSSSRTPSASGSARPSSSPCGPVAANSGSPAPPTNGSAACCWRSL